MEGKDYLDLNALELDALKEVSNIGAGNAATALAHILSDRVTMTVPQLRIIPIHDLSSFLGDLEAEAVGVLMTFYGDLDGMLLYLLERPQAVSLLKLLRNSPAEDEHGALDAMDLSALEEIGNIVAGAYINALADLTGFRIALTAPALAIDMIGALLSYPASIFGLLGDKVLFVREDFGSGNESVSCHLLIMPDPQSLARLMKRLGVSDG